jgi:hypothetical protein
VKSRAWLIAGFVAVFCLGAVAGGAVVAGSHARHQTALLGQPGRGSYAALLTRRLKLRPEQRTAVEAIISRFDADRERILGPVEPALHERRAAMRSEVRATLDPSQANDFDALTRELEENRARRGGHGAAAAASNAPAALGAANR